MFLDGPVYNPRSFAAGLFTGAVAEIAIPIYLAAGTDLTWYSVLSVDIAIKTLPRVWDWLANKSLKMEKES